MKINGTPCCFIWNLFYFELQALLLLYIFLYSKLLYIIYIFITIKQFFILFLVPQEIVGSRHLFLLLGIIYILHNRSLY